MSIPIFKMATIGLLPSRLKVLYYRSRGAIIGERVKLSLLSIINSENIEIGDDVKIGLLTFITARSLKIGNRASINGTVAIDTGKFELGADSTIMEQVVIGGMMTPNSEIIIGKRVKIFPFSFLNPTEKITIEDDVGIGGGNYIFTHGTWSSMLDGYPGSFGDVTIKKGAWLPWRVFVMPNVTIGENAIIGAGSVVTKNVPDRVIAAGAPAKVVSENKHIKELNLDQKHQFILKVFRSFIELRKYERHEVTSLDADDGIDIKYRDCTIKYRKTLTLDDIDGCSKSLYVSLTSICELPIGKIESGIAWFDIENRNTTLSHHQSWIEVRDFIGRYGVRFNVIE